VTVAVTNSVLLNITVTVTITIAVIVTVMVTLTVTHEHTHTHTHTLARKSLDTACVLKHRLCVCVYVCV
jgi:hypothetical protein